MSQHSLGTATVDIISIEGQIWGLQNPLHMDHLCIKELCRCLIMAMAKGSRWHDSKGSGKGKALMKTGLGTSLPFFARPFAGKAAG